MTTKTERRYNLIARLERAGFSYNEAETLRRIEMTLSRWSEMECGDANGNAIERDEVTGRPYMTSEYGAVWNLRGKRARRPIADRETGALKRLAALMAGHPEYQAYHQGDPRGCALYIVKRADLEDNERDLPIDSYYSRGIAVCE